MNRSRLLLALVAVMLPGIVPASAQLLQNDGYVDGQSVGFQGGFVVGERAGSRLTPPGPFPMQVTDVQFLFGGAATQQTVTVIIYDDQGGGSTPGVVLYSGDYQVTGSDTFMNVVDLGGESVFVTGTFRVALEFHHSGFPSVARDGDGNIQTARNFIYADIGAWFDSQIFGLTGDWIIRATVSGGGTGGGDEPEILTIDDVGNDQGRQVRLRFAKSDQDVLGAPTPITQYEVLRRVDGVAAAPAGVDVPTMRLDGWDWVTSLPAHGDAVYSVVVPTLADSTIADGMHWSVFFVRAATAAPTVFYDSAPDSGYSLDNLAPAPPGNVVVNLAQVAWDPAPEADFDYFSVYGSNVPVRDGNEVLLTQTTATAFDASGVAQTYVLVTATDFSGNEGDAASADLVTGVVGALPTGQGLRAWPNPSAGATAVAFDLPRAAETSVTIHDAAGRLVQRLAGGPTAPGTHRLTWNGRDGAGRGVANGVYLVRLTVDGRVEQRKIVLLR